MYPVDGSAGLTADQSAPQKPPSSRRGVYETCRPSATGARLAAASAPADNAGPCAARPLAEPHALKKGALGTNSVRPTTEFRELMEEPPGGHNAGRVAPQDPAVDGRWEPLGVEETQAREYVRNGGWTIVHEKYGSDAGVSAHRGVLHKDEHVDHRALLAVVEREFGFTREDVLSVYRQGRLSTAQGELRAAIDARVLALSRAGGNMLALARVFGLRVRTDRPGGGDDCPVLNSAIARAKAAELQRGRHG